MSVCTDRHWELRNDDEGECDRWLIVDLDTDNHDVVAEVPKTLDEDYDDEVVLPNAKLIVKAVNNHAALVAVLQGLFEHCAMIHKQWGENSNLEESNNVIHKAREVLTRLTHRQQEEKPMSAVRTISLPVCGITIRLARENVPDCRGAGTITSDLKEPNEPQRNAAIDGLEALILAHACVGVDVQSPAYLEGIETALDALANH